MLADDDNIMQSMEKAFDTAASKIIRQDKLSSKLHHGIADRQNRGRPLRSFSASSRPSGSGGFAGGGDQKRYFICRQIGHFKKDCPNKSRYDGLCQGASRPTYHNLPTGHTTKAQGTRVI